MMDQPERPRTCTLAAAASFAAAGAAMLAAGFCAGSWTHDRAESPRTEEGRVAAASPSEREATVRDSRIRASCGPAEDCGGTDLEDRAAADLDRLDREIMDLRLRIGLAELRKSILEASGALEDTGAPEPFGTSDRDLVAFRL